MGCNAIRTSHNPPAPELLDACDRMGVLVLDETRMMTSSDEGLDQLRTMILRDRNHPSIILWSIGNEEPQQGTDRGAAIAKTMKRLCNELDPTRLITAAMDGGYGDGITSVLDVIGFNYRDNKIDDFHAKFPKMPIIGTETGSTVCTRGEYEQSDARHIVPAYDTVAPWWANTAEIWWPHFDAKALYRRRFHLDWLRLSRRTDALFQLAVDLVTVRRHGYLRLSQGQLLLLPRLVAARTAAAPVPALELGRQGGPDDLGVGPFQLRRGRVVRQWPVGRPQGDAEGLPCRMAGALSARQDRGLRL
ncbi:MAG: glycoside hydrolase family 2 TIM barrel-domain containing protein [Asticcacaulis sp.]